MVDLQILITAVQVTDFYGVSKTVKQLTAKIGGVDLSELYSVDDTVSDETAEIDFKEILTSKDYTWDIEV